MIVELLSFSVRMGKTFIRYPFLQVGEKNLRKSIHLGVMLGFEGY